MAGDSLRVAQVYTEFDTKGLNTTARGMDVLQGKLNSIRNLLAGVVSGLALKSVAKSFIDSAKQAENYRTSIRSVSATIEEADKTFERVKNWAAVNPIDTDEAIGAFVRLKTAAVQNSEAALKSIADLSTVMHADMRDVASAVVTTETETLRNYGILLDKTGKKAILESNGIRMEVNKDIASIRAGIIELMGKSFGGSMDKAKTTWSGALATMSGMWSNFKTDIMGEGKNTGPFQKLKDQINGINSEWEKFTKSQEYKDLVSDIQSLLVKAIDSAKEGVIKLGEGFKFAKKHADDLKTILGAIVVMKLTSWFISAGEAAITMATSIKALTAAVIAFSASNPLIAGLMAAGATGAWFGKNIADYINGVEKAKVASKELAEQTIGAGGSLNTFLLNKYGFNPKKEETLQEKLMKMFGTGVPTPKTDNKTKGKSAAELLVENIRAQIKYLHADGESFLPVLQQWIAKTKVLSKDWMILKDAEKEITDNAAARSPFSAENVLARLKETKDRMAALREESARLKQAVYDNLTWQHETGLISDSDNVKNLQENFARLKQEFIDTGVPIENLLQWTPELQAAFSNLQAGIKQYAEPTLNALKEKFDLNKISIKELKEKAQEFINTLVSMGLSKGNAEALFKGIVDGANKAKDKLIDLNELTKKWAQDFQDGIADSIVESGKFVDMISNIGKEMEKVALKLILFGNNGKSGVLGGWMANLFGFHSGGIVGGKPTFRRSIRIPKFHGGGIVGANEKLIIAKRGEGIFTPEQMKALGGIGGGSVFAPNIAVHVTNGGGGDMSEKQAQELGKTVRDSIKVQVIDTLYEFVRSGALQKAY